ncbi:hypothetical protein NMY22_g13963 [Coprinellus aureogranulatus]|nr:hypothetical protein NMY22_g13963 [Coprinellus aureogranulatus]
MELDSLETRSRRAIPRTDEQKRFEKFKQSVDIEGFPEPGPWSTMDLWVAGMRICPPTCTPDTTWRALENLAAAIIPDLTIGDRRAVETNPQILRAVASLALLSKIAFLSQNAPDIRTVTLSLLLPWIDGVLKWIQFCFNFQVPLDSDGYKAEFSFVGYSELLLNMFLIDSSSSTSLVRSKTFQHLLLRIWLTSDNREWGKSDYVAWDDPGTCPMVNLLMVVLMDNEGRGAFLNELRVFGLERQLAASTLTRAFQVTQGASGSKSLRGLNKYASKLIRVVWYLCWTKERDDIRTIFVELKYFEILARMLDKVSLSLKSNKGIENLVQPLHALCILATHDDACRPRFIRELLSGGYLQANARVAAQASSATKAVVLKEFGGWTSDPAVLRVLIEWPYSQDQIVALTSLWGIVFPEHIWLQFWKTVTIKIEQYVLCRDSGWLNTCDNPLCDTLGEGGEWKPRKCSGCSTMVYCSPSCQRVDWDERHRDECPKAHIAHQKLRGLGYLYQPKARAFHVGYLQGMYNRFSERFQDTEQYGKRGDTLPILDCSGPIDMLGPRFVKDIKPSGTGSTEDARLSNTIYRGRVAKLVEQYRTGDLPPRTRVLGGIFRHTTLFNVQLLVVFREVGTERRAVYSVPYISDKA